MQTQEDYASAASRHVVDARYLCEAGRWDNAGYLAGYVVECGVKSVIERAGIRLQSHLNRIPRELIALAADLSLAARRYRVDMDPDVDVVRSGWTTQLRYARTSTLAELDARALVTSAQRVFEKTIVAMVLDGLFEQVPR